MTGAMYAAVVREQAPRIRAAYPRARIVALGQEFADCPNNAKQPWRTPLLDSAGELIDVLALQLYTILPPNPDAEAQHRQVFQSVEYVAATLTRAVEDCRTRGLSTSVGLTEWNLWTQASHFAPQGFVEPLDVQHGLFVASLIHHFARLAPEMELANFYHLIAGMGLFQVEKDRVRASHLADVFSLYRAALPAQRLALAVEPKPHLADIDSVDALALANEDGNWLFLVNKHVHDSATITLHGMPDITEAVTVAGAHPLDETATHTTPTMQGNTLVLPPLSITRLRGKAG